MRRTGAVWLALVLLLGGLYTVDGSSMALAAGIFLLLVPPVSAGLNLFVSRTLEVTIAGKDIVRKGETGELAVVFRNPTVLPIFRIACRIQVENQLNGQRQLLKFTTWLGPRRTKKELLQISSAYCGRLHISVEQVKLFDCFGVIGLRCKREAAEHMVVQPDTFAVCVQMNPYARTVEDSDVYAQDRPGPDLTETFQIREYVPGDSPRQIHWKLTGKYDKLIVRDPGLPVIRSVLVFWERTGETGDPEKTDAQAETVVSICQALVEQSIPFRLGWNDTARNLCIVQDIQDLDELVAVIPGLLQASGAAQGDSGAQLLLHTRPDALCAHMVYIAETPQHEVLELKQYGSVTAILWGEQTMDGAVMPDMENYPAELAQIEI